MFKKFFAKLSILALVLTIMPAQSSLAAAEETLITGLTLSSSGANLSQFDPSGGETLTVTATTNTGTFQSDINANSQGTLRVKQGNTLIHTFSSTFTNGSFSTTPITWDGKTSSAGLCGDDDAEACPDGNYTVEFELSAVNSTNSADPHTDIDTADFTIKNNANNVVIDLTSIVSGGGTFDPSPSGDNETIKFNYTVNKAPSAGETIGNLQIFDAEDRLVKTFTSNGSLNGEFTWDGRDEGTTKLVAPGVFRASISTQGGSSTIKDEVEFEVKYEDSQAPKISSFTVTPNSFDTLNGETEISFANQSGVLYTVELWNQNNKVTQTTIVNDQVYTQNPVTIDWDGKTSTGTVVADGSYYVVLSAINNFGVDRQKIALSLVDLSSTIQTSNAHIDDIDCTPRTFEPAEDDELECDFDVKVDLDDLVVYAVRGSDKFEIEDFGSIDEENNIEFTWDGTEDGDEDNYVEDGDWLIQFESTVGTTNLVAGRKVTINYDEPKIDEFRLTKEDLDPSRGEVTYAIFRIDSDAEIDLEILEGNDVDETVEEDFEVEEDKWYAIEVDLDDYDEDDDVEIRLVAKNIANDDIFDEEEEKVDIDEINESSSRSEIYADIMSPILSNGSGDFELNFEIDEDADVTVSIHKGTSSSGTKQIELMDVEDVDSGEISICWDGRDDDGDKLSDGWYTYKIVTKLSSSETRTGLFRIDGDMGEVVGAADGGCGGSSKSNDDDDDDNDPCAGGSVASGVVIAGSTNVNCGSGSNSGSSNNSGTVCAGFSDVSANSGYCDAIVWAKSQGIFQGYSDGTFRPFQAINRVEVLKVVLEAQNVSILPDDFTTQGFWDVQLGSWYMQYIRTAKTLGIFHGDAGQGSARPDATVNRAEVLKFVFETLKTSRGFNVGTCSNAYSDVSTGAWYYNYACQANTYGLFGGGNFLSPGTLSTRGEVAQVLYDLNKAGLF